MTTTLYYLGCWDEPGHYLHEPSGRTVVRAGPFLSERLDCKWAPGVSLNARYPAFTQPQDDTRAALHHVDGWTLLAMWDRSIDSRPGSNAVFLWCGLQPRGNLRVMLARERPHLGLGVTCPHPPLM